ncbi:uncharacterized protein LOC129851546 [Salvelinus fontinalis]|uniref:uncharacterized protein LOC129851546 n=1 Tax=Salvelinus fontinalis TaxID=8038 RepID=UPI0024859527|nr:uncharacterized protein LOC129851546 [Salvelinus fontinalis]
MTTAAMTMQPSVMVRGYCGILIWSTHSRIVLPGPLWGEIQLSEQVPLQHQVKRSQHLLQRLHLPLWKWLNCYSNCYTKLITTLALVVEIPAVTSLIQSLSKTLYALDSNKPSASELIIDSQARVPISQTCSQNDLCSLIPLFLCLLCYFFLSHYIFIPLSVTVQPPPSLCPLLYFFLSLRASRVAQRSKALHRSARGVTTDPGSPVHTAIIQKWTSYPDVLGMQFTWDGYFKQVDSAIIGCSSEFDLAKYSLCYITCPGKQCKQSLGGKPLVIQTYTWENSSYGNGKKYIGSAFPATP